MTPVNDTSRELALRLVMLPGDASREIDACHEAATWPIDSTEGQAVRHRLGVDLLARTAYAWPEGSEMAARWASSEASLRAKLAELVAELRR